MIRPAFLAAALALLSLSGCDTDILSAERDKTTSSVGTVREIDPASRRFVVRADGRVDELSGTDRTEMAAGDVFVIETPGGGGFGRPE